MSTSATQESPLEPFSEPVQRWFQASFEAPTPAQAAGWPAIASGGHTLICAPTGSGKTLAAFLWGIDRLAREPERLGLGCANRLHLAPQGPLLRHRAQPAGAAAGDRRAHLGRAAHRRHAPVRAAGHASRAAGHPDHDARVPLFDDQLAGPRDPHRRRGGDRGRDPRRGPLEAGLASGADHGAPRSPDGRPAHPADRALRDAAAPGADRPVPGGCRARLRDRRRLGAQAARPGDRRPGRGHGRAEPTRQQAPRRGRHRQDPAAESRAFPGAHRPRPDRGVAQPSHQYPLDLARDLSRAAAAGPRAQLDHRLRQQPPRGRANRQAPQRDAQRRAGGGAAGHRARRQHEERKQGAARDRTGPPRLALPRGAGAGRGAAQVG